MNPQDEKHEFLLGLDLGKEADPSALVAIERILKAKVETQQEMIRRDGKGLPRPFDPPLYQVRYLNRFALGTEYTAVAEHVHTVCQFDQMVGNLQLVVDASGVGNAVIEMLRKKLQDLNIWPIPIVITGGNAVSYDSMTSVYRVPKRDLVSAVRIPLEEKRLVFAEDLPLLEDLKKELRNFRVKVTKSANDIYEAREGEHDDIVLSVALPCWYGETQMAMEIPAPQSNNYNRPLCDVLDRLSRMS